MVLGLIYDTVTGEGETDRFGVETAYQDEDWIIYNEEKESELRDI